MSCLEKGDTMEGCPVRIQGLEAISNESENEKRVEFMKSDHPMIGFRFMLILDS